MNRARSFACRPISRRTKSFARASVSRSRCGSIAQGDLFCTDQEGATWVPNGNPFDELLHIQRGRHYGFPARHPTYVPNVIDEPSTFDYAPQHQSTCGFNFNEPVRADGPTFGPAAWAGDAIVTGYSRGKLYRTTARSMRPPAMSPEPICSLA